MRSQRGQLPSQQQPLSQPPRPQGWTANPSAFCCSNVSGSLCFCLPALADVAANLTHLASVAQHARRQGVGSEGFSSKLLLRRCVEKPEPVSPRVFVRDMDLAVFDVMDSRRLEVVGLDRVSWCTIGHQHNTRVCHQKRWHCMTWRSCKSRWSAETAQFFIALSNAKAESVPELLRGRSMVADDGARC